MNRIKTFFEQFAVEEAKLTTLKRKPNLENYNQQLKVYSSFHVPLLRSGTGHMPLTELRDRALYDKVKDYPDDAPRKLYKLSQYSHPEYQTVWVAFTSPDNPFYDDIQYALFIIEEDGQLRIAKYLLYTHYTEYGHKDESYRWHDLDGYVDLNFKSLGNFIRTERYLVPEDSEEDEGLAIYYDNI